MEREYKLNLIGEVIENYKIEKLIWHGGTSSIYKGISPNLNSHKIVAFKVLHPYRNTASQIKNFKKEFKILKKLSHPNIIEVYKFGQKSKLFYIVMEYFEGKNLRNAVNEIIIKPSLFPVDLTLILVKILIKIGKTIEYLHSKKIVHNDIKPENILISKDMTNLKLIDFGYSEKLKFFKKSKYTGGTDKYVAPERKKGILSFKSDIYSYAVMVEELLINYELFERIYPILFLALSEDPDKRPPLNEIIKKLEEIYGAWNDE